MNIKQLTSIAAASIMGIALAAFHFNPAAAQEIKAETSAGGCGYSAMILTAKYAKEGGVNIQVNDGKTLTKSMLLVGEGKVDISSAVPAPYVFMQNGAAMYKSIGQEKSSELAGNLRGMFGFDCGVFLPMVWDESPIKTWDDLKGKKVFTGPPSGAAALDMEQFIEAMTGFKPNVDYTAVRLNWGGAQPAMRDGQLEAYMRPMQVPSALVDELTAIRPLRLLPVTAADLQKPGMQKLISKPGNLMVTLKAHSYEKMMGIEQDMKLPGLGLIQVAGKHVPDDVVYRVTKSFFDNIGEIHRNNPAYRTLTIENPFSVLNVPLHPGAYKYFKEQGVTVPQNLLPPGIS